MSKPYFTPWVGSNYFTDQDRILLLGESHYSNKKETGDFTSRLLNDVATSAFLHPYFTNTMQTVQGRPHAEINRWEFWNRVAFYNYIQELVGDRPGIAPTSRMLLDAEAPFHTVLNQLRPKYILVLSKRLWFSMSEQGTRGSDITFGEPQIVRDTWIYKHTNGTSLASWIPHPSYYFQWGRWHPIINSLAGR